MLRVVSFWHQPEEYPHFLSSVILPSRRPPVKSLWMKNEHLARSHIQCGHLFSPDSLCQGSLEALSHENLQSADNRSAAEQCQPTGE